MHSNTQSPRTMNTLRNALIGFVLITSTAFAGQGTVVNFHGRVHLADPTVGTGSLVLTIEGQNPEMVPVAANGAFRVFVPDGRKAALSFSCPGHLTKTVLVETTNASRSTKGLGKDRKVEFDVMLSKSASDRGPGDEHLVGLIRFLNGSGLLKVIYDPAPVAFRSGTELIAKN